MSEVPDPYYGNATNFKMAFDLLDEACDKICIQLENDKS
jgi:protein-tyrosine-phosphatase|tara:strand:+ start:337 stop:453 length:117 start_codon:yes stop_codon:yes gene_type:complete